MADISSLSKPSRKGEPPKAADTVSNLAKAATGDKVPLQLKISADERRDFKAYALAHDRDANDLFAEVWKYYKDNHG
ncbi:MAG: hypothetical protein ABSH01_07110 [Terriglobia bacterium]|jgi:hypothetical protein